MKSDIDRFVEYYESGKLNIPAPIKVESHFDWLWLLNLSAFGILASSLTWLGMLVTGYIR
jgi:hypothetical protein